MQQAELELAKGVPAATEETAGLAGADKAATPAADKQARHSRRGRVREAHLAHEIQSSKHGKHEPKHETSHIARDGHGSKHEAKHDTTHIAREGHATKHEAAHTPRGGRERRRSA